MVPICHEWEPLVIVVNPTMVSLHHNDTRFDVKYGFLYDRMRESRTACFRSVFETSRHMSLTMHLSRRNNVCKMCLHQFIELGIIDGNKRVEGFVSTVLFEVFVFVRHRVLWHTFIDYR